MESNKIFAALLLAGVIAMTSGFVSNLVIHPRTLTENVFVIDTGAEAVPTEPAVAVVADIGTLMADADPAAGQALTRACAACHTFEQGGANRVGPNLYDIVGGPKAHLPGFNYSAALQQRGAEGETWGYEELNLFLLNPREYIPGTTMSFAGMRNDQERANMIAYLRSLTENPPPLPEPAEENGQ